MTKERTLTNDGIVEKIDGIDEITNIDLTPKESNKTLDLTKNIQYKQKPTKEERNEVVKQANADPEAKKYGVKAMKKSTYFTILGFAGFLMILLTINIFWSNINLTGKEFGTNLTVNTPVNIGVNSTAQITTPINNNFTIINENEIYLSEEVLGNITENIADKVISELNSTLNSS